MPISKVYSHYSIAVLLDSLVNCFLKESTWIELIICDTNKLSIHKIILIVPTCVLNLSVCWTANTHIPLKKNATFLLLYVFQIYGVKD